MPHDDHAIALFIGHLSELINAVGKPSVFRLETLSRTRGRSLLSHSTLDDHLRGKRKRPPRWPMVRELLAMCRILAEEEFGWDPAVLGQELEWHALWEAARRQIPKTKSPLQMEWLSEFTGPVSTSSTGKASAPAHNTDAEAANRSGDLEEDLDVVLRPTAQMDERKLQEPEPAEEPEVILTVGLEQDDQTPAQPAAVQRKQPAQPRLDLHLVRVPDLGEGGGWVAVTDWHLDPGDYVYANENLVTVASDMSMEFTLQSPVSGRLSEIYVWVNQSAAAHAPLCAIDPHDALGDPTSVHVVSPRVEERAKQLRVDLHQVTGTGKNGRVQVEDVNDAAGWTNARQPGYYTTDD